MRGKITRLTHGLSASSPRWSPPVELILHGGMPRPRLPIHGFFSSYLGVFRCKLVDSRCVKLSFRPEIPVFVF